MISSRASRNHVTNNSSSYRRRYGRRFNLFENVEADFGQIAVNKLKQYSSVNKKLAKELPRRHFLLKCRKFDVIPEYLYNKRNYFSNLNIHHHPYEYKIHKTIKSVERKYLNWEITIVNYIIRTMEKQIRNLESEIKTAISPFYSAQFLSSQTGKFYNIRNFKIRTLKHKFIKILNKQKTHRDFHFDEKCVINLTNIELPLDIKVILSLGPKCCVQFHPTNYPILKFLSENEYCVSRHVNFFERNEARSEIVYMISRFLKKNRHVQAGDKRLQECWIKTQKFLKEHEDIYVLTSDKGNNTVVMMKEDYIIKMDELLEGNNTYTKINKDPTIELQKRNNDIMKDLENREIISKYERYAFTSTSFHAPRLRGQPKIHKPDIPMRPISSTINAPNSDMSRMLAKILNNVIDKDEYNVSNSMQVKERISTVKIPKDHLLVSFDVVSLFTNIPVELVYDIINIKWNKIKQFTSIPYNIFMDMMDFCIYDANYFVFQKQIYKQNDGVPMGSPLAPTLAGLALDFLLSKVVAKLKQKPKFVLKYVDDLLLELHISQLEIVLKKFNDFHPKLQFTMEKENENHQIPYLDILITREIDNSMSFNWYHKPTHSGRILNFVSHHPFAQKMNVAKNLFRRILTISDEKYKNANLEKGVCLLKRNNYPDRYVQKWKMEMIEVLRRTRNSNINEHRTLRSEQGTLANSEVRKPFMYCGVSYINGLSESIQKKITQFAPDVQVAHKCSNPLRSIYMRGKDTIDKFKKTNLVYKIPCGGKSGEPCKSSYIGTTGRFLGTRIKEHERSVSSTAASEHPTALVEHVKETGHGFRFKETKIVGQENLYRRRMILESFNIATHNTINKREDTDNISKIYDHILNRVKMKN